MIGELPFVERELVDLVVDRPEGFGWARAPRVWLSDRDGGERAIDDALVIAVHSSDDQPDDVPPGDLELELALPDRTVAVLASTFLATWLPRLPRARHVVLAICNPRTTPLAFPNSAIGEVTGWLDENDRGETRVRLAAQEWTP